MKDYYYAGLPLCSGDHECIGKFFFVWPLIMFSLDCWLVKGSVDNHKNEMLRWTGYLDELAKQ